MNQQEKIKSLKQELSEYVDICNQALIRIKKIKNILFILYIAIASILIFSTLVLLFISDEKAIIVSFHEQDVELTLRSISILVLVVNMALPFLNVFKHINEQTNLLNFIDGAKRVIASSTDTNILAYYIEKYKINMSKITTEVDEYHHNVLQNEKTTPKHQKRMFVRDMIIAAGSIILIALAFYLTLVAQWTLPSILIVELILGYALMMGEYFAYQYLLYKDEISFHRSDYKDRIKNGKANLEDVITLTKYVLKMIKSRNEEYLLVLKYFVIGSSILSVFLSLSDILIVNLETFLELPFKVPSNNFFSAFMVIVTVIITMLQFFLIPIFTNKIDRINTKFELIALYKKNQEMDHDGLGYASMIAEYNQNQLKIDEIDMARGRHEMAVNMYENNEKINQYVLYTLKDRMETHKSRLRITLIVTASVIAITVLWKQLYIDYVLQICLLYMVAIIFFMILFRRYLAKKYEKWQEYDQLYKEFIDLNFINIDYIQTEESDITE